MKKNPKLQYPSEISQRVVFFDCIRIICIAIIVYAHSQFSLIPWFNSLFFSDGQVFFNIYNGGITRLAVFGIFFISGAVLSYSYKEINTVRQYRSFIFKRLIRMYPAFWMSLLLGIFLCPVLFWQNFFAVLFEFTGFFVILGQGPGIINPMGWFIGTIVILYALFPLLAKFVKKFNLGAVLALMLVSFVCRYLLLTYNFIPLDRFYLWFPLCNLFEFALGIYIVQANFYPKNSGKYPVIHQLAELSFYVFLFHLIVLRAIIPHLPTSGTISSGIICYCYLMTAVLLVSWLAMLVDNRIQSWIRNNDKVKKVLLSG